MVGKVNRLFAIAWAVSQSARGIPCRLLPWFSVIYITCAISKLYITVVMVVMVISMTNYRINVITNTHILLSQSEDSIRLTGIILNTTHLGTLRCKSHTTAHYHQHIKMKRHSTSCSIRHTITRYVEYDTP